MRPYSSHSSSSPFASRRPPGKATSVTREYQVCLSKIYTGALQRIRLSTCSSSLSAEYIQLCCSKLLDSEFRTHGMCYAVTLVLLFVQKGGQL